MRTSCAPTASRSTGCALRCDAGSISLSRTGREAGHPDERVTTLTLDITDGEQIRRAAERVNSLDVLINNAGIARYDDLNDRDVLEQHLAVNLFGTYSVMGPY